MKQQLVLIFVICAALGCKADTCATGMWGTNCTEVCGFCADQNGSPAACNPLGGLCRDSCQIGYGGEKCDTPMCTMSCGSGTCIAPDTCFCGEEVNLVKPNCQDIRLRGLIGSAIALGTLTISILLCGSCSKSYQKKKRSSQ